jgi:hypothetical protein
LSLLWNARLPIGLDMAKEFGPTKVPELQKVAKS